MKNYVEKMTALRNTKAKLEARMKKLGKLSRIGIGTSLTFGGISLLGLIVSFPLGVSIAVLALCLANCAAVLTNYAFISKTERQILENTVNINDLYTLYRKEQEEEQENHFTLENATQNKQQVNYIEEDKKVEENELTM